MPRCLLLFYSRRAVCICCIASLSSWTDNFISGVDSVGQELLPVCVMTLPQHISSYSLPSHLSSPSTTLLLLLASVCFVFCLHCSSLLLSQTSYHVPHLSKSPAPRKTPVSLSFSPKQISFLPFLLLPPPTWNNNRAENGRFGRWTGRRRFCFAMNFISDDDDWRKNDDSKPSSASGAPTPTGTRSDSIPDGTTRGCCLDGQYLNLGGGERLFLLCLHIIWCVRHLWRVVCSSLLLLFSIYSPQPTCLQHTGRTGPIARESPPF